MPIGNLSRRQAPKADSETSHEVGFAAVLRQGTERSKSVYFALAMATRSARDTMTAECSLRAAAFKPASPGRSGMEGA